jgi:hypothetical protein
MDYSVATVTIKGSAPYSQAHQHDEDWLEGESHDAYDKRTWRSKMNLTLDGKSVVIPADGVHQTLMSAAKYTKKKIAGQGNATWTAKFVSGIMIPAAPVLNIDPATVASLALPCNVNGIRGSGKRVIRRFPMMYEWGTTFDVWILDPIITQAIFMEILDNAGMYIGVGRWRPENGGTNGRFAIVEVDWQDNRQIAA